MQADAIQIGTGVVSLATLALAAKIVFMAGKIVEKVEDHGRRLDRLEDKPVPI